MTDFAINYAYDGFLYSPLFIAKHLGFLPNQARLMHRNGDRDAMSSLVAFGEDHENSFAICDPFANDLGNVVIQAGDADSICIIGALVGKLPVWLYGINPRCQPLTHESQLRDYKALIGRVVCYKKFNTGFLMGKHVSDLLDPGDDKTYGVDFGDELKGLQPDDISVTSDVLAVAESLRANNGNVKFNLSRSSGALDPFLFTAILTRRRVVEQQLPTVMAVLSGLQKAVRLFETDSVPPEGIDFLVDCFKAEMPSTATLEERRAIIHGGVRLLAADRIYSGNLDVATAEKGYNNARDEWHRTLKRPFASVENQKEPIPSLLMQNSWRCDRDLAGEFANGWKQKLAGERGNASAQPVVAVAKAWSDHEPTVKAVTETWLKNETSKKVVTELVGVPPAQSASPAVVDLEFQTLVPYISLAYLPIFLVSLAVVIISQRWASGLLVLGSCLTLMLPLLLLAYYWHPKRLSTAFRCLAAVLALSLIGIAVALSRDAIYPEDQQWGHHWELGAAVLAILIAVAAKPLNEPYKESR